MNTRAIVGVALTGVVILVSCTQDQTSAPSLPTEASFGKTSNTCDFTILRASAKDYFTLLKDPVYAKIDLMQDAFRAAGGGAAGQLAATDEGFAVLTQTAANLKDASKIKGTTTQGNKYLHDVFKCMTVAGYNPAIEFQKSLGTTGLFDVVDGSVNTAVVARYLVAGSPAFGAQPSTGNWPVAGPTLFYGWKAEVTALADETPKGQVADLNTLPSDLTFVPAIKAGACKVTDGYARPLHLHGAQATILAPVSMSFCIGDELIVSRATSPMSGYAFGLQQAASWLAPRPLLAMPTSFGGGGAGLVDGLSQVGPVSYTSVVSYTQPPVNTTLSASPQFPQTVTVTDTTSNGNPLKDVLITLSVVGNNGGYNITGDTATTNSSGIAVFPNLRIDKAGGYVLRASSAVGGFTDATFNISGQ